VAGKSREGSKSKSKSGASAKSALKAAGAAARAAQKATEKLTEALLADPEESEDAQEGTFPIVGIGASAGGLEAFTEMLQALPNDTGMAFVFVQHLDPKHVSILTELLQRHTKMPVQDATEGTQVEPNHVYVIPRNKHMGIAGGVLTLSPRISSPVPHMPIDPFLRSLAADQKSKSIGVILSGNASDGTLGMLAVKAAGGITFAQSSETAKYDGMPRSAVAAGCIDFVLSPKDIALELYRLGRHPYISPLDQPGERGASPAAVESIGRILALLRTATGVDFTYYKASTIRRRILRLMALRREDKFDRYIGRLRNDDAELHALYEDILINVTEFFRDPEVFDQLKAIVFPKIIDSREGSRSIRIWVPGCSSGEEVYSIAIVLLEYLGEHGLDANVQIFGTDVSEVALDRARSGTYPPSALQDVSEERLRRFFAKVDSNYQISKRIREMCVFAKQNLIKDPPFSKLDLISCRNVLIYLAQVLQKRIIPVFHYALKPNGFLLLGSSETIGPYSALFSAEDRKAKIYKRRAGTARAGLEFPIQELPPGEPSVRSQAGDWNDAELLREADRIVIGKYGPAGVVVDKDLNILQFRGHASLYLEPSPGVASLNLLRMAREGLSGELQSAMRRAQHEDKPVSRKGIRIRRNSGFVEVNIEIVPLQKGDHEPHYLILFEEAHKEPEHPSETKSKLKPKQAPLERENSQLRQELSSAKEYLQSVIEEHESANEELRSANEEIQSSNEELQSANEELETAKEELQSTNEELNTVNEELQTRNLQLAQAGNDLLNLLSNVNIPVIMLGNDLRIRRFTPVSQRLLNLIPADVGRPLSDINLSLNVPRLDRLVMEVIDSLSPRAMEVRDLSGRPYSLRIRPYRTEDNKIDGAVLVLVDLDSGRVGAESVAEITVGGGPDSQTRSSEEARAFGAGLLLAQEVERRNLALELHDDLSQRMALLQLNVQTLERSHPAPPDLQEQLRLLDEQIGELSGSLRKIAYRLHPAALEDLGLARALESYVHEFGERENIQVTFQVRNMPENLDSDEALCLYRIVQESLRNIAQHAQSKSAQVSLTGFNNKIKVMVKDAGRGFDAVSVRGKGRLGLRSMEERARALGGTFRLQSIPGQGTELEAEVPVRRRESGQKNNGAENSGAENSSIDTAPRV